MDWLQRMNGAIDYIESNLTSDIDWKEVSKVACCSAYNYSRFFTYLSGIGPGEYVRRRRLTLAAFELQNSDMRVIDVAVKYGYDSPISFARAFQAMHGVTPTSARKMGVTLRAYPRISFHISIRGDVIMEYRIERKGPLRVFGIEKLIPLDEPRACHMFWQESHQSGAYERLFDDAGAKGRDIPLKDRRGMCPIFAVMNYRKTEGDTYPYMIGAFADDQSMTNGYMLAEIPAMTWAIFRADVGDRIGSMIPELFRRAYSEWLPIADYEKADAPEFEVYGHTETGDFYDEIWMPVLPK